MVSKQEFHIFNNRSYIDLYPVQFGKEICQPLHSFGPTKKQHYLFHYIVSGSGDFYLTEKQKSFHLTAGQGFLIAPDSICSYEADLTDPWTYIWIEFDGLKAEHFLHQAGLSRNQPIFSSSHPPVESDVYKEIDYIQQLHNAKSAQLIGHLYLFIAALIEESATKQISKHSDAKDLYIREAINFVERNLDRPISIDDIAKQCNLNRHYFSRLFKEQMGISPQQFLIQYRMSRACELLKDTDKQLKEIAELVGYSNQFNFSTAFKNHYQLSPNQWRQKNKGAR